LCAAAVDTAPHYQGPAVKTTGGAAAAGSGSAAWDGRDDAGRPVAAGSYFCYLQTGQDGLSRKFVLTE
jgi:flagellar hook assembly protein FlgD